jgi:hypothetical protein
MDRFIKELMVGDIHLRDKWQIELKSEFVPLRGISKNTFKQEFFLFIPNSLQINEETYPKEHFYRDRTIFLRYKTPEFSLQELDDPANCKSPLAKLRTLLDTPHLQFSAVEDELKLLGNVLRSSLREEVRLIVNKLRVGTPNQTDIATDIDQLCKNLNRVRKKYLAIQGEFDTKWKAQKLNIYFRYNDEFISNTINYYLTGLLAEIRNQIPDVPQNIVRLLCEVLEKERQHRKKTLGEPTITDEDSISNEFILYRSSLLNKFILDALLLNTQGTSVTKRFSNLIGSISAGIAMLFFFVLFVWQGQILMINSFSFIMITVILYILKDRIKEILRVVSFRQFSRWFSDYTTEIRSPDGTNNLGRLKESFSYIEEKKLSKDIQKIRDREFHDILETIKRPEKVIYYKKELTLYKQKNHRDLRRNALNLIFRFNIRHFLNKADNPTHEYLKVDPQSFNFVRADLPKVYHINIIMRNTYLKKDFSKMVELKKFRLIINKSGIKRIEQPNPKNI